MKPIVLPLLATLLLPWTAQADQAPLKYYGIAPNAPFSAAVRAGDTLYVSGQIGAAPQGGLPKDFTAQADNALDNVAGALALAGASMDDVAKCTVMLTDMSQWQAFNARYVRRFKPGHLPARSAIGASALAMGAQIEIECIAYLPRARP
ncbi:MAG: RidA family protein [Pseudoxanthomonas sp.]